MGQVGVYRLLNVLNGKSYVGSSVCLEKRKATHFLLLKQGKSSSPKLQNAYNAYGAASFVFEVLEECEESELQDCELKWIDTFDCVEVGYNCVRDVRRPTPLEKYRRSVTWQATRLRKKQARQAALQQTIDDAAYDIF